MSGATIVRAPTAIRAALLGAAAFATTALLLYVDAVSAAIA